MLYEGNLNAASEDAPRKLDAAEIIRCAKADKMIAECASEIHVSGCAARPPSDAL